MLLDVARQRLIQGDEALSLMPTEFGIVEALARRGGVVTYEHLITLLWQMEEPGDAQNTLKVHVCKLRRKLRLGGWPALVGTIWGRGYYLCIPVEVWGEQPPLVIPNELRSSLRQLLLSHPDAAAADRILLAVGG